MQRSLIWMLGWLAIILPGIAKGQNLVPNGSFENYRNCPTHDNQLIEATPWYNPNKATPDFYHHCFDFGQLILPPHSGQGVAHLYFDQDWEEYLGVRLTHPLKADECYYFEMYVATNTPAKYITETIGAYVSKQPLTGTTTDMLTANPQILDRTPKASVSSLQWQKISGVVNAKGGEEYLTIGSFYKAPPFLGYYYLFVDDVLLTPTNLELGNDTTLCSRRNTLLLDATTPGAADYKWNDGSIKPTLQVTKPGKYSVTVITSCKTLHDSIKVDYALDFDLGADTTLCNGMEMQLSVPSAPAATYRWQDGSAQTTYRVRQQGQYSITVTQANCVATDTIQVRYIKPPQLELGPDKELCGAETFTIKPIVAEGKFSWQDQYATRDRTVNTSGVFWASVRNDCATVTDSIEIDYGACDCILYAPNSFTPNDDGQNDVFLTYGCGDIKITSLSIFNRWGEVIYRTTTQPFQWDGYYRGKPCEIGVYAWSVQYELHHGKKVKIDQKQGPLSLIR
ncbi:T9SS type B sorting domain-containing protein [Spirosoma litoris]